MKRLLMGAVSALAAIVLAGPSLADEPPAPKRSAPARVASAPARQAPAQQAQPRSNWTGGQLGGSNGGSSANNAFVEPGSYICPAGSLLGQSCFETQFAFSGDKASYTIGPFLGYRVQLGGWVVGVEGDFAWKNAETSGQLAYVTPFGERSRDEVFSGSVKQGWDASIRARLGVLVTPWTLLYATGGVAFGEVSGSYAYRGTIYGCPTPSGCPLVEGTAYAATSWSETRVGATVGAGVETEVWTGWKARLEYRYTDLGDFTKTLAVVTTSTGPGCCGGPPSYGASIDLSANFHTVRVGLGVDF